MDSLSLEEIIRRHVPLSTSPDHSGWFRVLCKVCNDHGRKGKRAGFKFDQGGVVGYNCFNCGRKTKYDPSEQIAPSENMKEVLVAYGISESEWEPLILVAMQKQGKKPKSATYQERKSIEPQALTMPAHFYPLKDASPNDKWSIIARDYLEHERNIDPSTCNYPFLLSTPERTGVQTIDKWRGRLIIPIYKNGVLIYYQGRALYDNAIKKYESPAAPKEKVLYGFDRLFEHTDAPLYVVEGFFDAFVIDGVAVLGNELSDSQAQWLALSRRKKVYIPDKRGDGHRIALDFIRRGWYVSTPDIGGCKDVNEAVRKYGKVYVLKELLDNTSSGTLAETQVELYCEKQKKQKVSNRKGQTKTPSSYQW